MRHATSKTTLHAFSPAYMWYVRDPSTDQLRMLASRTTSTSQTYSLRRSRSTASITTKMSSCSRLDPVYTTYTFVARRFLSVGRQSPVYTIVSSEVEFQDRRPTRSCISSITIGVNLLNHLEATLKRHGLLFNSWHRLLTTEMNYFRMPNVVTTNTSKKARRRNTTSTSPIAGLNSTNR